MKFSPDLMTEILSGNKTVTRRPFKGKRPYTVGREYTATDQPRWKKTEFFRKAKIKMLAAREEVLLEITEDEARKEGFKMKIDPRSPQPGPLPAVMTAKEQFFLKWGAIYGVTDPMLVVTRYEFVVVKVLKA